VINAGVDHINFWQFEPTKYGNFHVAYNNGDRIYLFNVSSVPGSFLYLILTILLDIITIQTPYGMSLGLREA
jgi:hypothetical protein